MLTQNSRKDIEELVESGVNATIKWLDSLEEQLDDTPVENYSGELIDKRPEEKKKQVSPLDLEMELDLDADTTWGDPIMEIEFGSGNESRWKKFKTWFRKKILRIQEITEEEEIQTLLDQFSPFGEMHNEAEGLTAGIGQPKNLLPDLTVLRQAVAYAELLLPVDNNWDKVRAKCANLRQMLSKSLGPSRSAGINNSGGSKVALEVEIMKDVELSPEVISRHVIAARQQRQ